MKSEGRRVAVIGAGVIGAACAYYLRKVGWEVTLVEKDRFGRGSSHGNCGLIIPTHALPLNMPGAWWRGLKWMLDKQAPLFIKPRADLDLLHWLLRFALRCNRRDMLSSAAARAAMLEGSLALYEALVQEESLACEWERRGVLYVFRTQAEFEAYRAVDELVSRFGESGQVLDRQVLRAREPSLTGGIAGAWFYPGSAHLRPDFLMRELERVLRAMGVGLVEAAEVRDLRIENGRARAAVTTQGTVEADAFVVATGAWTPLLNRALGCRIPIQPGKGYSVTFDRAPVKLSVPCMLEEDRVVLTPWASGCRLGGTMEFVGWDETLNRARVKALYEGSQRFFGPLPWGDPTEEWCAWRPMTADGVPIIDRPPGIDNVILAVGHNMLGMTLAPGTGKLVSELLSGLAPHLDPTAYRLERFAGWR